MSHMSFNSRTDMAVIEVPLGIVRRMITTWTRPWGGSMWECCKGSNESYGNEHNWACGKIVHDVESSSGWPAPMLNVEGCRIFDDVDFKPEPPCMFGFQWPAGLATYRWALSQCSRDMRQPRYASADISLSDPSDSCSRDTHLAGFFPRTSLAAALLVWIANPEQGARLLQPVFSSLWSGGATLLRHRAAVSIPHLTASVLYPTLFWRVWYTTDVGSILNNGSLMPIPMTIE